MLLETTAPTDLKGIVTVKPWESRYSNRPAKYAFSSRTASNDAFSPCRCSGRSCCCRSPSWFRAYRRGSRPRCHHHSDHHTRTATSASSTIDRTTTNTTATAAAAMTTAIIRGFTAYPGALGVGSTLTLFCRNASSLGVQDIIPLISHLPRSIRVSLPTPHPTPTPTPIRSSQSHRAITPQQNYPVRT